MRILLVHNRYQQAGGEDRVFERERALLQEAGHEVETYERDNHEIGERGTARTALDAIWSRQSHAEAGALIARFRPDVLHAHNTFPLVSPSVFHAAQTQGVPVVQTLHNFRLACLNATLLRDGQPCRSCVGRVPWRGVAHGCYQGGIAQSAVLAASLTLHRIVGTYRSRIRTFIALTRSAREEFVAAGLPAERIVVKPNFVAASPAGTVQDRANVLYVGRLSPEKGIATLAEAARLLPDVRFVVAGTGPSEAALAGLRNVALLGQLSPEAVLEQMRSARCLVMPSLWPEGMPMALLEAFSCGLPVIASDIGSLGEIVEPEHTGLLFQPGDAAGCAARITDLIGDTARWARMSLGARAHAADRYGPARNLELLEMIYASCLNPEPALP
jgi:glycosyltransferase involved in cell wall biosynthesis